MVEEVGGRFGSGAKGNRRLADDSNPSLRSEPEAPRSAGAPAPGIGVRIADSAGDPMRVRRQADLVCLEG